MVMVFPHFPCIKLLANPFYKLLHLQKIYGFRLGYQKCQHTENWMSVVICVLWNWQSTGFRAIQLNWSCFSNILIFQEGMSTGPSCPLREQQITAVWVNFYFLNPFCPWKRRQQSCSMQLTNEFPAVNFPFICWNFPFLNYRALKMYLFIDLFLNKIFLLEKIQFLYSYILNSNYLFV